MAVAQGQTGASGVAPSATLVASSSSATRPAGRGAVVAVAVALALLPFLLHRQFLSSDAVQYGMDAVQLHFPRYRVLCDALQRDRSFPLWQTLLYGGAPFHANPENPTLYPPALALAAFASPVLTINLLILTHLGLASLGAFFLVRRLWLNGGGEPAIALAAGAFAGVLFGSNGYTRFEHFNLVLYGAAHALLPWILLAAEALLGGRKPARVAGWIGLLLGLQIWTGGLYVMPYTGVALVVWLAFRAIAGGPEARSRLVRLGPLAVGIALCLAAPKLLPYRDWLPTTNRGAELTMEEARGVTLGGHGTFVWSQVWLRARNFLGLGYPFLPALLSLFLWRRSDVRAAWLLASMGFLLGLGGSVFEAFYSFVPLFDQVRDARRAWTLVNAFLPICGGLGLAWAAERAAARTGRSRIVAAACGVLTLVCTWPLQFNWRHEEMFRAPDSYAELLTRYPNWTRVAELAGDEWRAAYASPAGPEGRNEQFITAALRIETTAGYLGHVWPSALERHLFAPGGEPLERLVRARRLGILSVRWLVEGTGRRPTEPPGIDGRSVQENPFARPRAFRPTGVCALVGDEDERVLHALLDAPSFPLDRASVLSFEPEDVPAPEELRALRAVVLCAPESPATAAWTNAAREHSVPITTLFAEDVDALAKELEPLLRSLGDLPAASAEPFRFERPTPNELRWEQPGRAEGGFVVFSEPWFLYPGWNIEVGSGENGSVPASVRRADGMASAVYVGPGEKALTAHYRDRGLVLGFLLGALGLLGALLAVLRSGS